MAPNPALEAETREEPKIQEITENDEEPPELEQVDVDAMKAEKASKSQEIWGNDEPAEEVEEPRIVEIPNTEPVDLDA